MEQMSFDFEKAGSNTVTRETPTKQTGQAKPLYEGELIKQLAKLPKGIVWIHKAKSENFLNVCRVGLLKDDAYFELKDTHHVSKTEYYVIPSYKETSYCAVMLELYDATGSADTYPLGMNFDDCLSTLQEHGMDGGYFRKVLRPIGIA